MNILLVVTVIWLSDNTTTENIGLFETEQNCTITGSLVGRMVMETNNASSVAFTCTPQTEG